MRRVPARPLWPIGRIALIGIWAGLLAGTAEVVIQIAKRHLFGHFVAAGRDLPWIVPLTSALVLLALALLIGAAGTLIPQLRRPGFVLFALGWPAAFSVLRFVPRISPWALGLIAAGLVIQVARVGLRHEAASLRLVRISTGCLAVLAIGLGGGAGIRWRWTERRALAALPPAPESAPNILLLVLDTVRAAELSLYGYPRPTTPNLARRAHRAVVFERAYTESPWTLPAHAAMFTGRPPTELSAGWFAPLDGRYPTVAEAARDAGFFTAGFVANQIYAGWETGLGRGFLHYADQHPSILEAVRTVAALRTYVGDVEQMLGHTDYLARKTAADVNAEFLQWIDAHPGRPFFAFLNYFDAHSPYDSPPDFQARFRTQAVERKLRGPNTVLATYYRTGLPPEILTQLRDRYDASIGYLDQQIEELFRSLEQRGLADRTVVILTSDHGELLGEWGLIDHGNSLYPPLLHVPLIVWDPRSPSTGLRVTEPVSTRNLAATIQDIGGLGGRRFPGRSLADRWTLDPEPATDGIGGPIAVSLDSDRRLWWTDTPINRGNMRGIIGDSLMYIRNGDATEELYRIGPRGDRIDLSKAPAYQPMIAAFRTQLDTVGRLP